MSHPNSSDFSLLRGAEYDIFRCQVSDHDNSLVLVPLTVSLDENKYQLRPLKYREKALLRSAYFWIHAAVFKTAPQPELIYELLEAIHALEQLQAWDLMTEITLHPLPQYHNRPFHEQLRQLGLLKEQIHLYQLLLGKVNVDLDMLCMNGVGVAKTQLGQYETAIDVFLQCLELAEHHRQPAFTLRALHGLAYSYMYWGQYSKAINYLNRLLLEINVQSASQAPVELELEKGKALAGLGYCMYFLRRFAEGIGYNQQAIDIAKKSCDIETQWRALGSLSLIYSQMGDHKNALACLNQRLNFNHDDIDEFHQITALVDLGANYCYQRRLPQAIQTLQDALEKARSHHFLRAQCQAFRLLGFIYSWQGKSVEALECLENGLAIAQRSHYTHHQSQISALLSFVYCRLGQLGASYSYALQALHLADQLTFQNDFYRASANTAMGLVQFHQGKYLKSIKCIGRSMMQMPPWKSTDSKILFALLLRGLRS